MYLKIRAKSLAVLSHLAIGYDEELGVKRLVKRRRFDEYLTNHTHIEI